MGIRIFIGLLLLTLVQGCAKIGTPGGGPEDVLPPEYISGSPENGTVNYDDDQIDINFNEYIQLKDQSRQVIVSPPMDEKPVIRVREKSIRISFSEELLPQTTYTVNFGKSISDLNEGNPLPDFEYVFSTGSVIDSLSVTGKVVDAFTLEPEKDANMLVMLYKNLSDSAPLLEIPRFYTLANEFGLFAINNIDPDTFRLIAVNDANNNLKYDVGLEKVAFADSLIIINHGNVKEQTFIKDTIKIITPLQVTIRGNRRDTTSYADTVIAPGKKLNALNISIYSFTEQSNRVVNTSRTRDLPEQISFIFNRPLFEEPGIEPLNFNADSTWVLPEISHNSDTVIYWITDTLIAKMDTLRLRLTYLTADSTGELISKSDTIRLRKPLAAPGQRGSGNRRARQAAETAQVNSLSLSGNIQNRGTLNLNSNLVFFASRPLEALNGDSIELFIMRDTIPVPIKRSVLRDSNSIRKFIITADWEEEAQYRLFMKPGAIYDIYNKSNDSVEISFSTRPLDYYGRILLNFSGYVYPMIVQLKNEKGLIVSSTVANKSGILTFDFLAPGKYSFKAIYDANQNGKWDSGSYLNNRQPEKIFVSKQPQQLRSNWDLESSWSVTRE